MTSNEPWIPRGMRQSGSALRKLIRSVVAAGVSSGDANGQELFLRTKPQAARASNRYWDRLLIGPAHWPAPSSPLVEIVVGIERRQLSWQRGAPALGVS
jgi:hypothetical protein